VSSSARSSRAGDADLGAGGDRVSAAAADLYGLDPQEFTDRRKTLAAAARAVGDAAAAKQISALRKPTRAAWIVNRLARADPGAAGRLASLAADLRAAEQARDGPRLRELSAARGQLIDALTGQALATAGVPDPPAGLREEVSATLTAALADPDVAAEFAAGTLTRAAQWAGFGLAPFGPAPDAAFPSAPDAAPQPGAPLLTGASAPGKPAPAEPLPDDSSRLDGLPARGTSPAEDTSRGASPTRESPGSPAASRPGSARPGQSAPPRTPTRASRRTPSAATAEEAARQAARRREIFENAERVVATAEAATAVAAEAEDRLEAEVRDLEERLTKARADLADARLRARRAEAAERKARQTLDRLPRP
jgi:hypothetical protein